MSDIYEVLAVEYARSIQPSRVFYMFPDPHDGPRPITYFVWVIRNPARTIVVDTGFGPEAAKRRNRELIRHPSDALKAVGVDVGDVATVIITHMHFDHAGTVAHFPRAEFVLQEGEVAYATGRPMRYEACRRAFDCDDVVEVVRANFGSRVRFVNGEAEIAPGVSVHLIGGHSGGLQIVRVTTDQGPLVLASDAAHFYDTVTLHNPHPIVADMAATCAGYERIFSFGAAPERVIPGHDPLVTEIYPPHMSDPRSFVLTGKPTRPVPWTR